MLVTERLTPGKDILRNAETKSWQCPKNVLMVRPDYFRVDYAINPYMKDQHGNLKVVDHPKAMQQWHTLAALYKKLGLTVHTLVGQPDLPDMVFAANQSFVFCEDKTPKVVMGVMRSQQRRPEVDHFEEWYRESGYDIHRITTPDVYFEGNGDALLDPTMRLIWGGVGPRTTRSAYEEISSKFNIPVLLLPLRCAEFYHLDTCFSILASDAVAIQPRAFDEESVRLIRDRFPTVIEIDFEENITTFAANCHSPNGRDVILHKSVSKFNSQLEQAGFTLHHVDTSEFMKSGGSVFCMKMMVY